MGQARRDLHGQQPDHRPRPEDDRSPTPPSAGSRTPWYGGTIYLTGKDSAGLEQADVAIPIEGNSTNTVKLQKPHKARDDHLVPDRLQPEPDHRREPDQPGPDRPDHPRGEARAGAHRALQSSTRWTSRTSPASYLAKAEPQQDDHYQPAVGFVFNRTGGRKFAELTRDPPARGRRGIASSISSPSSSTTSSSRLPRSTRRSATRESSRAVRKGSRPRSSTYLITVLRSGSLPASLNPEPLQEENVGPTLGEDTIAKGIRAIVISMIVVPVFMIDLLPLRRCRGRRRA